MINNLYNKAKSAKIKAETQLKSLEGTIKAIGDSGLTNKISATKKSIESAFSSLDTFVKKYKSIISTKAKKATPTCSVVEIKKLSAKVISLSNVSSLKNSVANVKRTSNKKLADAKKKLQETFSTVSVELEKVSKKLVNLKSKNSHSYKALKARIESLRKALVQLKSANLATVLVIASTQVKANNLLKEVKKLSNTATQNLSTAQKQRAVNKERKIANSKKNGVEATNKGTNKLSSTKANTNPKKKASASGKNTTLKQNPALAKKDSKLSKKNNKLTNNSSSTKKKDYKLETNKNVAKLNDSDKKLDVKANITKGTSQKTILEAANIKNANITLSNKVGPNKANDIKVLWEENNKKENKKTLAAGSDLGTHQERGTKKRNEKQTTKNSKAKSQNVTTSSKDTTSKVNDNKDNKKDPKKDQKDGNKGKEQTKNKSGNCNRSPKIDDDGSDDFHLSYTKRVPNYNSGLGFQIYLFDKNKKNINYICCNGNEMEISWKDREDKTISDYSDNTVLYLTGGPGWGCGKAAFYKKVESVKKANTSETVITTSEAKETDMLRDETLTEACLPLQNSIGTIYSDAYNSGSEGGKAKKAIKKTKEEIEKVGTADNKKNATDIYNDAVKLYDKISDSINVILNIKMKQCELLTQADVDNSRKEKDNIQKWAKELGDYQTKIKDLQDNVVVTPTNFRKMAQSTFNAIMSFWSSFSYAKAYFTLDTVVTGEEAAKLTKTIQEIIDKAKKEYNKKHATNEEAKKSYDNLIKLRKDGEKAISDYKEGTAKVKDDKKGAEKLLKQIEEVKQICKSKLRPYNPKAFNTRSQKNNCTPKLIEKYNALDERYSTAKKNINKGVSEKLENEFPALLKDWQDFLTSLDVELKVANDYVSDLKTTKENIQNARIARNYLTAKDKELADKATELIETAEKTQNSAVAKFDSGDLASASTMIAKAKTESEKALEAANQKIDTKNYTSATTTNAKQRAERIYDEVSVALSNAKKPLKSLKEYSKEKWSVRDKKLKEIDNNAIQCKKDAKKPKTDDDATKAIQCLQKAKTDIEAEQKEIEKELKATKESIQIKAVNNVISMPDNKVSKVSCSGNTVTISFQEKVFIDLKEGIIIKGNFGCYDSNTKQKGAYTRTVGKIITNEPKKITFESKTNGVPQTSSEKDLKGFSFSTTEIKSVKKGESISTKLNVSEKSYIGKKAEIQVISATNNSPVSEYKKTVTIAKSTSISIPIDSNTPVNSAFLRAVVDGKTVATTKGTFSINPTIKIILPDKQNETYYQRNTIRVKYDADVGTFNAVSCSFSFVSTKSKKPVHTIKSSYREHNVLVKQLPDNVISGEYQISLDCNNVVVMSVPFNIVRDDNAIARIVFTYPPAGEVFKKGDEIDIQWNANDTQIDETFDLSISSEDKSVLDYITSIGAGKIKSGIRMREGHYKWTVDERFGSSKYFFKASWAGGREVTSERFTLNKERCFKFKKIDVKEASNGSYDATVFFDQEKGCYLKDSEEFVVTLVTVVDNKRTKDLRKDTLKADKSSYNVTLNVQSGYTKNLRFLITTDKDKKGEISDDFSCPLMGTFDFVLPKKMGFDCNECNYPDTINDLLKKANVEKSEFIPDFRVDVNKFKIICKFCEHSNSALEKLTNLFSNITNLPDITKKISPPTESNKTKVIKAFDEAEEDPKKMKKMFDSMKRGMKPFNFQITCTTCKVKGSYKAYNFASFMGDVKTANIEVMFEYDIDSTLKFSIGYSYSKTAVLGRHTGNDANIRYLRGALAQTEYDDYFKKLGDLKEISLPLFGEKLSNVLKGVEKHFDATLQLSINISFTLTGTFTINVKGSGKYKFEAKIENDVDRSKKLVPFGTPSLKTSLIDAEVSTSITASLDAEISLYIRDVFNAKLKMTFVKVGASVSYKKSGFGQASGTESCTADHHFEVAFDLSFATAQLDLSVFIISISKKFPIDPLNKEFKICF